ncbi:hypothetical protein FRB94_013183 [Tulasnella sp. JGI-2019a]|nr:hypothetical protein FRB94_013183 [Tulasnella sp. JGI-2019a]
MGCNPKGIKRNRGDMKELAFYIAALTNDTLRPLEAVGGCLLGPAMKGAMKDFYQALQEVEHHMGYLASRNPWKRFVSYDKDIGSLNRFKDRIEEARRIMTIEISIATLTLVGHINAFVRETHDIEEITPTIVEDTALIPLEILAIVEDTALLALDAHTIMEDNPRVVVEDKALTALDTVAIGEGTHVVTLNTRSILVNTNAVARATDIGVDSNRLENEDIGLGRRIVDETLEELDFLFIDNKSTKLEIDKSARLGTGGAGDVFQADLFVAIAQQTIRVAVKILRSHESKDLRVAHVRKPILIKSN